MRCHAAEELLDRRVLRAAQFCAKASEMSATLPDIPSFYAGQSIFLTGGTGYLGKVCAADITMSVVVF